MIIRKFNINDTKEIITLIHRNLLEYNIKDYNLKRMIKFAQEYTIDKIIKIATNGNMYVICDELKIVGCGAIMYNNFLKNECIILSLFVLPEYHNKGIGKKIIETLEKDPISLISKKIIVNASLSSNIFYEKMGFSYKNNKKIPYLYEYYQMEKIIS